MENKSLLNQSSVKITDQITLNIPTIGEILDDEAMYFSIVSVMTATPYQYMVQLDDIGIDYTKITDYQLFQIFFPIYAQNDVSIIFGDLNLKDIALYHNQKTNLDVLYSPLSDTTIDEFVYYQMARTMRQVNCIKYERKRPKGEHTKKYLLEKERRHLKNLELISSQNSFLRSHPKNDL